MERIHSRTGGRSWIAIGAVVSLALAACGGDDDDDAGDDAPVAADDDAADAGDDSAGGGGGGGGFLELGAETIDFDSALCFLEEQDAAAGGGKILFVAQATGTNAAGEEVLFDATRFDEDSDFAGDDVKVNIGDYRAGTDIEWSAKEAIGTISVDGSTVSAEGMTFTSFDADPPEQVGSFEINC